MKFFDIVLDVQYFFTCRDAVEALLKYEASTNIPDYAGMSIMFQFLDFLVLYMV